MESMNTNIYAFWIGSPFISSSSLMRIKLVIHHIPALMLLLLYLLELRRVLYHCSHTSICHLLITLGCPVKVLVKPTIFDWQCNKVGDKLFKHARLLTTSVQTGSSSSSLLPPPPSLPPSSSSSSLSLLLAWFSLLVSSPLPLLSMSALSSLASLFAPKWQSIKD